ncbi:flagellar hook protein FlgE [Asticcacaulis sp. YBE204]|uniref:flagellar hook protein FlgE n=1 Tax=Asticcacaulis sp. YBE204 TaxID=1282363 RepID=UPI0003C3E116|nr:flagellar hook protein FlgE [Asticcacaulis sp. YBE204]ESQ81365.1 hypothetical protein AEYBE204_03210 [Asticcacaulis sp. YBE204]
MSGLNAAMQAGVSGLAAFSTSLSAISNNIANVNTTGYKRVRTDFQAIVTASSTPTGYNAGGVIATTRHMISQLGTLQKAATDLDLGIDGQGFFVTTQKADATAEDTHLFTRDGSFSPDKQGYLRNSAGLYLQGWPIAAGGSAVLSAADLSQLTAINVDQIAASVEPTTFAGVSGNLNAAQAVSNNAARYVTDPTTYPMSKYDASTVNTSVATGPDYEISIPVSDSLGGERNLTMSMIKLAPDATATPPIADNTWAYEVWSDDVDSGTPVDNIVTSGRLVFNSSGKLESITQGGVTQVDANGDPVTNFKFNVDWKASTGVADQEITLDFNSAATQLTQLNAASTSRVDPNGTPFSGVDSIKISDSGMVTAVFKNGSTRDIAQLALATFVNADGLTPVSGNAYSVSNTSGPFTLKVPGVSGSGLLSVGTLEASGVDLSEEFTNLITTQRAYSANSKTITTADEMLQELLQIKR